MRKNGKERERATQTTVAFVYELYLFINCVDHDKNGGWWCLTNRKYVRTIVPIQTQTHWNGTCVGGVMTMLLLFTRILWCWDDYNTEWVSTSNDKSQFTVICMKIKKNQSKGMSEGLFELDIGRWNIIWYWLTYVKHSSFLLLLHNLLIERPEEQKVEYFPMPMAIEIIIILNVDKL